MLNFQKIVQSYAWGSSMAPVSTGQLQVLHIILREQDINNEDKYEILTNLFNRTITSSKQLTFGEAEAFLNLSRNPNTAKDFFAYIKEVAGARRDPAVP